MAGVPRTLLGLAWTLGAVLGGCEMLTGATERELAPPEQKRTDCAGQPCPAGTVCVENQCRASCDLTTLPCLDGQACVDSVCIDVGVAPDGGVSCADGEVPDDGNPCTEQSCFLGRPRYAFHVDGTPCPGGTCTRGSCSGPCEDGKRDGKETGVDCGGGECRKCDDGAGCRLSSDCEVGICTMCSSTGVCTPCLGECTPALCGEPPITVSGSCFAVVLLRNGALVEAQSSPELCESLYRTVWKRGRDVTYVYSESAPDHTIQVAGSNPAYFPIEWFSRCVRKVSSRSELITELNASSDWTRYPEPVGSLLNPRMTCPDAALYKW